MSYGRDPDARMRGVGSIASIDGVTSARARAQAHKDRVMARIDARHARVTHGPGRALPVPMGAVNRLGTPMQNMSTLTLKHGGILEAPAYPGAARPPSPEVLPRPPRMPTPKPPPFPTPPRPRPVITVPVRPTGTLGPLTPPKPSAGGGTITTFPGSATTTPPTIPPFPAPKPPVTGGGGGGAGVVIGTQPTDPVIEELLPMPEAVTQPSSSMSTGTKVAIGLGALGLLYLATRNR